MRGAPVDHPDKNGFYPIHIAARLNHYDCVMLLLHIGVDCNVTTISGFTPLYMAVASGATQAQRLLIENGGLMAVQRCEQPPGTILDAPVPSKHEHSQLEMHLGLPGKSTYS